MWTLQKLKGKEGGCGEMVKKKGRKERSRRRHQDEREDVQAGVGPDPQAGRCWVQLGQPPMLSYLSISTGESWRERAGT